MKIALIRHGEAENTHPDEQRELSTEGKQDIMSLGTFLKNTGWKFQKVFHSPLVRTHQTASILSQSLSCETEPWTVLRPGASPEGVAGDLLSLKPTEAAALVFHMPDVARIAAYFLGSSDSVFYIPPGTVLGINLPARPAPGSGLLLFSLQPEFWHPDSY